MPYPKPYSKEEKRGKYSAAAAAAAMRKYAKKKKGDSYDGDMDGDVAGERRDGTEYGKTMKRLRRMRKKY